MASCVETTVEKSQAWDRAGNGVDGFRGQVAEREGGGGVLYEEDLVAVGVGLVGRGVAAHRRKQARR